MPIVTLIAIYFIIWWVVLFAVLPWGVRSQQEAGSVENGTDPGAPAIPNLLAKIIWTTIVTTVLFCIGQVLFASQFASFDGILRLLGMPH